MKMSFTANTRTVNNAALHYKATVTSNNIMQQYKLAECVWEYSKPSYYAINSFREIIA